MQGLKLRREIDSLLQEEGLIGVFECPDVFWVKTAALQANEVEAPDLSRVSICDGEGRDVLHDFGAASDHGVGTHPAELVNPCHPGEDDVVLHCDVACQGRCVRKNAVIPDYGIVCDVSVGKKVIVGSDPRGRFRGGAPVDGDELPKGIAIADLRIGGFPGILEVLAPCPDGREGIEHVVLSNSDGALKDEMRVQMAPRSDANLIPDDAVRTDFHIIPDLVLG